MCSVICEFVDDVFARKFRPSLKGRVLLKPSLGHKAFLPNPMRRIALAVSLVLASIALSGAGVLQQHYATFTPEQHASLDRISAYLNSIKTLKGGFEQIDPNGAV